jgi:hypothetical protein
MKKATMMLLAVALTALSAGVARAGEELAGERKGNLEIAAYGSLANTTPSQGAKSAQTTIGGSVGWFYNRPLEIGLGLDYFGTKSNNTTATFTMVTPFVKWHFFPANNPKLVPYVGFDINDGAATATGAPNVSVTGFGLSVGADYFISEMMAVGPELRYDALSAKASGASFSEKTTTLLVQLKAYFGS